MSYHVDEDRALEMSMEPTEKKAECLSDDSYSAAINEYIEIGGPLFDYAFRDKDEYSVRQEGQTPLNMSD